jgi:uncharacterized protein (TIGR02246 family)
MKMIACLLTACAVSIAALVAQSKPQPPTKTAATVDAAIKAIADQYVKATLAGDAKAIAALYTEDAVEMPPNQPPVKGRTALLQFYEKQLAGVKFSIFALEHLETRAVGDTGYDVGTYRQTITPPKGPAFDDTGKYVVLLKRVGGSWKVAYAIYNSDMPPPPGTGRQVADR